MFLHVCLFPFFDLPSNFLPFPGIPSLSNASLALCLFWGILWLLLRRQSLHRAAILRFRVLGGCGILSLAVVIPIRCVCVFSSSFLPFLAGPNIELLGNHSCPNAHSWLLLSKVRPTSTNAFLTSLSLHHLHYGYSNPSFTQSKKLPKPLVSQRLWISTQNCNQI